MKHETQHLGNPESSCDNEGHCTSNATGSGYFDATGMSDDFLGPFTRSGLNYAGGTAPRTGENELGHFKTLKD